MRILVGQVRPIRIVARRKEVCTVCREVIPKGDCLVIVPGLDVLYSHKKCESELVDLEISNREKTALRMAGNTHGRKK